ncbi:MAG: hypothetical protein GXY03_10050 [Solirubrobacterales bacterium]|nr:hypothetical protein [Solirubrobacterales bacterium]
MSLPARQDFRDWLYRRRGVEPTDRLDVAPGPCRGCGAHDQPVLLDQCLVCWAEDYGRTSAQQEITDSIRSFAQLFLGDDPHLAHRAAILLFDNVDDALRMAGGESGVAQPGARAQ